MATTSTQQTATPINIIQLPSIDTVAAGSFFIVETPDGTAIIDFENIVIDLNQTTFETEFEDLQSSVVTLSTQYVTLSSSLYSDLLLQFNGDTAVFKNVSPLTGGNLFSGLGVDIPFNYIEVNGITDQQIADNTAISQACGDTTLSPSASAFVFSKGTYKTFITSNFSSLCAGTTWLQTYLYQKTPPTQVLIHGSSQVYDGVNVQGTSTIVGYFYLCRDAEISLKVDAYGQFKVGAPSNALMNVLTSTAGTLSAGISLMLQSSACNISMYIEKVGEDASPTINRLSLTL